MRRDWNDLGRFERERCRSSRGRLRLRDLARSDEAVEHDRVSWAGVQAADWIGLPSGTLADGVSVVHGPSFSLTAILLVLPGVIALVAENTGHVKAVAEMTGEDLDPYMGRAIGAEYATEVRVQESAALGQRTVEVRVQATLPLVGLLGAPRGLEVTAHAPVESFD